jgi:CubicO group peptidase (beta-lactamase class C family)
MATGAAAWAGAAIAAPDCSDGHLAVAETCVPTAEATAAMEVLVAAAMTAQDLRAAIAGVSVGGGTWITAQGESMTGVPATAEMHFRSGSVAIAYTGVVLLQLVDAGTLGLDDRLSTWFPDYPRADEVTLRMLIDSTSGYADYVPDKDFERAVYAEPFRHWTPDELIGIGIGLPMHCDPGTCWSYAHTNFVILGEVIEKATGRPLEALIAEGILAPLGLENSRSEITATIQEPVLHAFTSERGIYEESTFWDPSWTIARGAVMTANVGDLLASAAAIGEGTLLSPESHALQVGPGTAGFVPWSETTFYGYGVIVSNGWILQNPLFSGFRATMAYLPSRGLAIAATATIGEDGKPEHNASTDIVKAIAAYLAPEAPL